MKIQVRYLQRLVDALVTKHNKTHDKKSFDTISGKIAGLNESYLYKKIVHRISKKKPSEKIGVRDSMLEALVKHLDFKDINAFIQSINYPISEQLKSCIGTYYTYLRKNAQEGFILRSPVKIFLKENKVHMELKGKRLLFSGELKLNNGYLYVLLENEGGKRFYHGYKIGVMDHPLVLQGVFSGVSSGFDPIGGRVVLIRVENEKHNDLTIAELDVKKMKASKNSEEKALAKYFADQSGNNISINKTTSFTYTDLTR